MKLEDITSFEEKHKYLEENLQNDMYVRTSDNGIDKFKFKFKNDGKPFYTYYFEKTSMTNPEGYIVKEPSFELADLIEENDYIRIITSNYFEPVYYSYGKLVIRDDIDISKYTNKFIAEVITKEQMEAMKYKVVE